MKKLSLYIHIPFCAKKCAYCDFVSYPDSACRWPGYFDALRDEIAGAAGEAKEYEVGTIYFGGGTPSLVPADEIALTLDCIRAHYIVSHGAEITIEANPGTVTAEKLAQYRASGINRISFGVQSFCEEELRLLGRIHSPREAEEAIAFAREAGFQNLSLDLMYELPGQTMETWENTLRRAVLLAPEHISAYTLIVEEGTPLAARIASGELVQPDEETAADMRILANRILREAGYERYEISNYARPDFHSRHNSVYWARGEYIGFGCAAHSFFGGARFRNPDGLEEYAAGVRGLDRVSVSQEDAMEEAILLGTRTRCGIVRCEFESEFGLEVADAVFRRAEQLKNTGLITFTPESFRLTDRGLDVQNAVVMNLIDR